MTEIPHKHKNVWNTPLKPKKMTEIPLKLKKWPKYPWTLRTDQNTLLKRKNVQNKAET